MQVTVRKVVKLKMFINVTDIIKHILRKMYVFIKFSGGCQYCSKGTISLTGGCSIHSKLFSPFCFFG
jgi:hypothetical protein